LDTNIESLSNEVGGIPEDLIHDSVKPLVLGLIKDAYQRGVSYTNQKHKTAIFEYAGRTCGDCGSSEFKDYNGKNLDSCVFCGQFKEKKKDPWTGEPVSS